MRTLALGFAMVVGAMLVGQSLASGRLAASQTAPAVLAQPASWVAFTANVSVEHPQSAPTIGVFFRDSNGSTRLETGPPNSDLRVISIRNLPNSTQFVGKSDGSWVSSRMQLEASALVPMPFHAGLKGLTLLPDRVSIRAGEPYSLKSQTGFSVYAYAQDDGGFMLLVPDLNFFAILRQRGDGRREAYRDVVLGEPSPELFSPPPGAVSVAPSGPR